MYANPCRTLGQYPPDPTSGVYVSEGFPAECLQHVPNEGFRWLCGEPVPEGAALLLQAAPASDPISEEIDPADVYYPDGGYYGGQPNGQEDQGAEAEPAGTPLVILEEEPGYGILGWLAGILVAVALS